MQASRSLLILSLLVAPQIVCADTTAPEPFRCVAPPPPVVKLDHGSRYEGDDSSRSSFDGVSNDDVNAQLKPVDDFVADLASAANWAVSTPADRVAAADCVLSGLEVWARAGALDDLATMNAQLSVPARLAGLAFAYAQIRPYLTGSDRTVTVETWLAGRARATMVYFDTDAPANASRNNLRAWAALAVARVGISTADQSMIEWADASTRLVACQAAKDGSLPLEMARGELALHYQLHAVTPLVVTAALLQAQGHDLFMACDKAIHRTVGFVIDAFQDPALAKRLSGTSQSYFNGTEELRAFELAWAEAYLSLFLAPRLSQFVAQYGALANSKLGGRQSLLWPD